MPWASLRLRLVLRLLLILPALVAWGCGGSVESLPVARAPVEEHCCLPGDRELTLEYTGVGGWLLRYGDSSLMTAPFFSNPGLLEVGFSEIRTDTAVVDRFLPPVDDLQAILVGHAHYDHLLDVPYVARRKAPRATIYGSLTTVNTLRGAEDLDPRRLVDVQDRAGDVQGAGEWIDLPGGEIRFMALRSGHAPHYLGVTLFAGDYEQPLDQLPDRASGWLEGQSLAYLIDLLGPDGEVVYRIHYQDSAAAPPEGFPPQLPDRHPVDLLIVCVPGAEELEGYPEVLVESLGPSKVLLGHWEDFFRTRDEPLRVSPGTELDAFVQRLEAALGEGAEWVMPEPGTVIRIQN